uniref:Uncharacterized protein n=1 Tax=viral metagenome TaxID=1070528 RepID=A0A6C0ADP4_9ZZZZ
MYSFEEIKNFMENDIENIIFHKKKYIIFY